MVNKGAKVTLDAWLYAVEKCDREIVKYLLKKNPELINKEDENGWTALSLAAYQGNKELVKWLINKGAAIDSKTIFKAVEGGSLEIVELLLEQNSDLIDAENANGDTPLNVAEKCGNSELAEFLEFFDEQ